MIAFFAFEFYQFKVNEPKAQVELENEFRTIQHLPDAVPRRPVNASHSPVMALVGTDYSTNLKYPEIRAYYDAELAKHGWRFIREEKVTDWDRDLGGKEAIYYKGDYVTSIQYAGEKANYGWTYSFNMSWKLAGK